MSLAHTPPPAQNRPRSENQTQDSNLDQSLPLGQDEASGFTASLFAGQENQSVSSVCPLCGEIMNEKIECLILVRCHHAFHRACIENYLLNQSECPVCRQSCDLSDLQKISLHKKSVKPQSKPRGAMAKQYHTRSMSRNLAFENLEQTPLLDSSPKEATGHPPTTRPNNRTTRVLENSASNTTTNFP
ncbi:uncharacterized protein LOC131996349 [Stomoxys calcitrans]|uniref:uncharacterized protein LOC131996349 n=1 Tax=Stomoxys calcitrans TaxID=35570 RepID=UPI0027E2231C|nr:uncharacterized protein LOC131996349 [Stomoxys calcitrans]